MQSLKARAQHGDFNTPIIRQAMQEFIMRRVYNEHKINPLPSTTLDADMNT